MHAVANTGATSVFIMDGIPTKNKRLAARPVQINLPDGWKVTSSHICDITIPSLPITLTGHVVPDMTMASLLGKRVLCKAGCIMVFDDKTCRVYYKSKLILTGYKDPTSNSYTLPIGQAKLWTTPASNSEDPRMHKILLSHHIEPNIAPACATMVQEQLSAYAFMRRGHQVSELMPPQPGPCIGCAPQPPLTNPKFAMFFYHHTTKTNAVKFMHQSLCNPPILLLIKAINTGFLKGALHLSAKSVMKYLSPSLATSKGHMKWLCKGLWSTTPKQTQPTQPFLPRPPPAQSIHGGLMPGLILDDEDSKDQPALITDVEDDSIANVFCFGAFADNNTGVVYNNCTGTFPFMSLEVNVYFLLCIITKPMQPWPHLYLDWIQRIFWMHTRKTLNTLWAKGIPEKST